MVAATPPCIGTHMPSWVPEGALHYLAHTELGHPIRALARMAGCHASTILRQIRRIEMRRDDPLVDAALRKLGDVPDGEAAGTGSPRGRKPQLPDEATLEREAVRVLRRLCETGAVLAVAAELDKAVVVRDMAAGGATRTAVVASDVAQAMALKDWIAPIKSGRIVRYQITRTGRSALDEMLKNPSLQESAQQGFAEAQTAFEGQVARKDAPSENDDEILRSRRMRYSLAESPLIVLARRRGHDGQPFLSDALVCAGERLREDFELGQMGAEIALEDIGASGGDKPDRADAASQARARVAAALTDLGPGLSDVVMRCCCYLEGLETTEKRLGWSARSGKIVLRIALLRLQRHYEETIGPGGPLIG